MRIPLAPRQKKVVILKRSETSAQDIKDSWSMWVASRCPRVEPEEPNTKIRLLNNLKPYTPPWVQ